MARMPMLSLLVLAPGATLGTGSIRQNRGSEPGWQFLHAYPNQYVARKLGPRESITIDGDLSEEAWLDVDFTKTPLQDIAQPLFPGYQVPAEFTLKVKVRWDARFVYLGVELGEPFVTGIVTGHNPTLASPNPIPNSNVPYYDNDFEVFVDVSGTNYYYKEFEMNFLNATYDVLWRVPDGGLGSVGVPCCSIGTCSRWCQNSSYPLFGGSWSMYPAMQTATARHSGGWTAEIAFPLHGGPANGGLLDGAAGWERFDPNNGAKYWLVDFSRAEHPFFTANASEFGVLCPQIQKAQPTLLGTDQWSCYWEWAWQSVGGHRYMHNPNSWGYLQFANASGAPECKNAEWPIRYLLEQVYQAEVAYVQRVGTYSADLLSLLNAGFCTIANGCNSTDVRAALTQYSEIFHLNVNVDNSATSCVKYASKGSNAAPVGGPCFTASATGAYGLYGTIKEDRYLEVRSSAPELAESAPCLGDYYVAYV